MSQGYDQFFKKARQAAQTSAPDRARPSAAPRRPKGPSLQIKPQRKKRIRFPWAFTIVSLLGTLGAAWGVQNFEDVEKFVKQVEISWMGQAVAQSAPAAAAPATETKAPASESPALSAVEIDHLSRLNDRKKELDLREQELQRQEAELARQKEELENRLRELSEMREKISEMLADRVKTDEQKIETLVQMYSNMKPPQAAKIFETIDEDLAIEILGRMKKKNAADIMNLLNPEKAQVFSEKFAGYKRK